MEEIIVFNPAAADRLKILPRSGRFLYGNRYITSGNEICFYIYGMSTLNTIFALHVYKVESWGNFYYIYFSYEIHKIPVVVIVTCL